MTRRHNLPRFQIKQLYVDIIRTNMELTHKFMIDIPERDKNRIREYISRKKIETLPTPQYLQVMAEIMSRYRKFKFGGN
ncbi:MAG: hypothetical protein INQ03_09460 [Candidatus Heimdallarchaeota archaeon]|nr:hypothetical protein [Candidatus Heimdallarchaeota archaeon]